MKKLYATFLMSLMICILLAGCISSPEKHYFQLNLLPPKNSLDISFDQVMLVESVKTDDLYDDYRIIYRLSPFQLNYYPYDFWADKPAVIIRDSIIHYLKIGGFFKKVIKEFSRGEPDLILRSRLHFIEEVDQEIQWYARLSMDLEIIDFRTEEIKINHHFDRMERMEYKKVSEVPRIISRILEEELEKILKQLQ